LSSGEHRAYLYIAFDQLNAMYRHIFQAMLSDDLVAEAVNEKVETFYRNVKARNPASDGSLGQIAVLFTQKRSKKTWFSSTEVSVCSLIPSLEAHTLNLASNRNKYRSKSTSSRCLGWAVNRRKRYHPKRSRACRKPSWEFASLE
jgi:hypothetical protein